MFFLMSSCSSNCINKTNEDLDTITRKDSYIEAVDTIKENKRLNYLEFNKTQKFNQYDSVGKKQGWWIDKKLTNHIFCREYDNDTCIRYYVFHNNYLSSEGEYKNGFPVGTWFEYDDDGRIMISYADFGENNIDYSKDWCDYKCLVTIYSSGNISQKGWIVFSLEDGPDSETAFYVGNWEYFDEKGNVIETKKFK